MSYPPYSAGPGTEDRAEPQGIPVETERVQVRLPTSQPVVTYAILAITILVYILQQLSQSGPFYNLFLELNRAIQGSAITNLLLDRGFGDDLLIMLGGRINPLIDMGQIWRLFSPVLLHFSLLHIGSNMYSLFVLGPTLERFYGHKRFVVLYILTALGGNILSYLLTQAGVSAGASTAIFGLIGAEGIFIYRNRGIFGRQSRSMLTNVVWVVAINLFIGVSLGFDNWGHLGGLLTGLVFGWFAGPYLGLEQTYTGYGLVDRRSTRAVWTTAFLLVAIFIGLVVFGIFYV